MAYFNPDHALESQIRDFSIIPLSMGRFLISSDTQSIFYDLQDKRINLTDIIPLDTESQREAILAPLDKFYFVKESCTLWRYVNGKWKDWPSGISGGGTKAYSAILAVNKWVDNQQVMRVEGLSATQNGVIGLSQDVSAVEIESAGNACMYVSDQEDGALTISLGGDKPTCDIPVTLILFS